MNCRLNQEFQNEFEITSDIYLGFKAAYKDFNPIHVDVDLAKSYGFEDKVMYGNILNGFLSYFVGEMLPDKNVMIISQSINYHNPFFLNNKLTLKAIVVDIHTTFKILDIKYIFMNQDQLKIAKGKIQVKYI